MGALADLGLSTADGGIMCVSAPDSVLAEAGAMSPRPSFASTLLTAEPTARLVWWPERQHLAKHVFERLRWLIEMSGGQAWLVLDEGEEESPSEAELLPLLDHAGLKADRSQPLGRGETALRVSLDR
jgi:hypothetical protein